MPRLQGILCVQGLRVDFTASSTRLQSTGTHLFLGEPFTLAMLERELGQIEVKIHELFIKSVSVEKVQLKKFVGLGVKEYYLSVHSRLSPNFLYLLQNSL